MRCIVLIVVLLGFNYSIAIKRCSKIDACRCSTDEGVINLWNLRGDGHKARFNVSGVDTYLWSPCDSFTQVSFNQSCTDVSVCRIKNLQSLHIVKDIGDQQLMDCKLSTDTPTPSCMLQYRVKSNPSVKTQIMLHCDPSKSNPVLDSFSLDYDHDVYNSTLHSECACPGRCKGNHSQLNSYSLSTGSLLIVIFLCFVLVYLVGGMIFNKVVKGASGRELIPHVSFWMDFPLLVKDGVVYSATMCLSCGKSKKGYTTI